MRSHYRNTRTPPHERQSRLFGAKNAMMGRADVGHAGHSAVPSGLWQHRTQVPNVETLGYCQDVPPGQRDCRLNTTISGPKPVRILETHFYLVHPFATRILLGLRSWPTLAPRHES